MAAARRPARSRTSEGRGRDHPAFEPRAVVEGAGRALQQRTAPPADSFADGVEAHRTLKRMCPETEAGCDLGPYLPPLDTPPDPRAAPGDAAAFLGGLTRTIRFPPFWHAWFSRQTETRLETLDELVDERTERRVLRGFFRRLKHALIIAFVASATAAHWFSDQIGWLVERLPALKAFWTLVTGAR